MPRIIRSLQDNWGWASGLGALLAGLIWGAAILYVRVDSLAQENAERKTENQTVLTVVTEIKVELAKLRTLLEERTK